MKSLLAVARLVTRHKLRKLDVLSAQTLEAPSSKFRELYDALQDGAVRTDRDAARLLYDAEPGDARYRQLKSRFRRRLYNTLFFVDQNRPHRRAYDHTYHSCQREWALVNILRAAEADVPAAAAAKALLATCLRYGFTTLTVACARYLADEVALAHDPGEAERYAAIAAEAAERLRREVASAGALRKLRLSTDQRGGAPAVQRDAFRAGSTDDAPLALRYDYLEAEVLFAERAGDLREACRGVDAVAGYAASAPHLLRESRLRLLRVRQLRLLLALGDDAAFEAASTPTAELCPAGSAAWHRLMRLRTANALAADRTSDALSLCATARAHPSAADLHAAETETWLLLHDLTQVLAGVVVEARTPAHEAPQFGRGYGGLLAWRLVVDVLNAQLLGDPSGSAVAVDALREHAVRQLSSSEHPRLYAFAHVLYRLSRDGDVEDADAVGARYRRDLAEAPFRPGVTPAAFAPVDLVRLLHLFTHRASA